jgi:transcriptional regulator with XRE-family HTH domain
MPPSQKNTESFGERLARLRKARGFTQVQLGQRVGISRRMVAYYEGQADRPPAHVLDRIASVLQVSADQLLGIRALSAEVPFHPRLWQRLKIVEQLSPADRKALIEYAEYLLKKSGRKPDKLAS